MDLREAATTTVVELSQAEIVTLHANNQEKGRLHAIIIATTAAGM